MRLRPANGVVLWQQEIVGAANRVVRGSDVFAIYPSLAELTGSYLTLDYLAMALGDQMTAFPSQRLSNALNALHMSGGRMQVKELATHVGCTPRQLNRMFRSNVGLSTKTYAQLTQFHRALKLIQGEQLSITETALESGYSDQAHLTRAFQRFGGFTPSNLPHELTLPALFV